MGGGSSRSGDRINETPTLEGMARKGMLWPTPTADGGVTANLSPAAAERFHRKNQSGSFIEALSGRMWPTPTVEGGESKGMSAKRLATRAPDNLNTAVKFASPAARDFRSGRGRSENGHTPQLPEQVGGQLNPTWVERLMGFPDGWTKLED